MEPTVPTGGRVLVCCLNSTRGHEVSFPSFKRHVLDELQADLALGISIDEDYDYRNPFWQQAKYTWTVPHFPDLSEGYDLVQQRLCAQYQLPATDWRSLLDIGGIWMGGVGGRKPYSPSLDRLCRWATLRGLQQSGAIDRYERFVITRSDFVWLCPHPPLSILDEAFLWVPDGEDYGGLTDRHVILSRTQLVGYLSVIEPILLDSIELREQMKHDPDWNNEKYLMLCLRRLNLIEKVKRFPFVMYLAGHKSDVSPTWSRGRLVPALGHRVKYPDEFRSASAYASVIRTRADWVSGTWKQFNISSFDAPSITSRPAPMRIRVKDTWERGLSALSRPGRVSRLLRGCKRLVQRIARAMRMKV